MTTRCGLLMVVAATLLAGTGCICCGNRGYGSARDVGPDCDIPGCQRNQVYVFAVGGLNPAGMLALDALRVELNKQGFSKVATGQSIYTRWMMDEMQRVRVDEPEAVFVIVGSEAGGPAAVQLAEKARTARMPVTALVLIDSEGRTPAPADIRTLTVGGYGTATGSGVSSVLVPDVSRYSLAGDPRTGSAVAGFLKEVALGTEGPVYEEVIGWSYPFAPLPRPTVDPGQNPEWAFLFDQTGGATTAIGAGVPMYVPQPPTPTTTTTARRP
jgi:hypothetical protein